MERLQIINQQGIGNLEEWKLLGRQSLSLSPSRGRLSLGFGPSLSLSRFGPVMDRAWLMAIHSMIYNTPSWMP